MIVTMSLSSTDNILIQLIDNTGVVNAGYTGSGSTLAAGTTTTLYTTGFGLRSNVAATQYTGTLTIKKVNSTTWVASGVFGSDTTTILVTGGASLSTGTVSGIRLTSLLGTQTFDAGTLYVTSSPTS
jgi:hypothetical protein